MNTLVNEFLAENRNDPHKAYDEYIKHHLLCGMPIPTDITGLKDFIKQSEPEVKKKKQRKSIKKIENMDAKNIIREIKESIESYNDSMKWYKERNDQYMFRMNHSNRETLRIILCRVTYQEYEYIDDII